MGVGHTFKLTPVGVYFGAAPGGHRPDPYFGGVGPARTGCIECGECMTGCRHNAKNTLVKNYLGLAEACRRRGAPADHRHQRDARCPTAAGRWGRGPPSRWRPARSARRGAAGRRRPGPGCQPDQVMSSPAVVRTVLGTQNLLHRMRPTGTLPGAVAPARAPVPHQLRVAGRRGDREPPGHPDFTEGSRSRRRSSRTRTRTSSRSGTARAPTRWACSAQC